MKMNSRDTGALSEACFNGMETCKASQANQEGGRYGHLPIIGQKICLSDTRLIRFISVVIDYVARVQTPKL